MLKIKKRISVNDQSSIQTHIKKIEVVEEKGEGYLDINEFEEIVMIISKLLDNDNTSEENREILWELDIADLEELSIKTMELIATTEKKKKQSRTKSGNTKNT